MKVSHNHGVYYYGNTCLCAGCGAERGVFTVAIMDNKKIAIKPKEWPFNTDDCAVCYWRDKSINAFGSEDIAKNFPMKTILNALIIKREKVNHDTRINQDEKANKRTV